MAAIMSNGGSTSYYAIPEGAKDLLDLIEHKNMDFCRANIFKAAYRFGEKDGASRIYDLNKIIFFAMRLRALEEKRALSAPFSPRDASATSRSE